MRLVIAAIYFLAPFLVGVIAWRKGWYAAPVPGIWSFAFCVLAGCWGIAVRAVHLRDFRSKASRPWLDYVTTYLLTVVMNASLVFTLLVLFDRWLNSKAEDGGLGVLFYTAALPLCMVGGLYCNPDHWLVTKWLLGLLKEK